jgi:PleD family two-component response regulator
MTIEPRLPQPTRFGQENWLEGTPWYQRAYFEERVSEELYRSRRYKTETSIVLVRIPAISRRAARSLYTYVSTQLRAIDTAGMLGTGDYVVCLPHTPRQGGEVVASRIRAFLEEYGPQLGVSEYGDDGETFEALLASAETRLD